MKQALLNPFTQYGAAGVLRKLFAALLVTFLTTQMASAKPLTIAAFGDSLTQGYGLPDGDGLVPQLQRWLRDAGEDVQVLNAGVSGDTTAGGLARIDWTLTPDIGALIVTLGGNDLLRGLNPSDTESNLDGILRAAAKRGLPILLVGLVAPSNYGPDYKTEFDKIYATLSAKYNTLFFPSFLGPLREHGDRSGILRNYMQADAIHPNAKGVAIIVDELGPFVKKLIELARKQNVDKS